GEEPALAAVPTSFREWSRRLRSAALEPARTGELALWTEMLAAPDAPLGARPLDQARDVAGTVATTSLCLPARWTAPLLTTVPAAFNAGVNDVLPTGL